MKSIKVIISEEVLGMMKESNESQELLGIPQLAQIIANLNGEEGTDGPYYEGSLDTLTKAFRYGGDEAVQKEFKNNTNKDLRVAIKGKYFMN
jgi:hypothetical protein